MGSCGNTPVVHLETLVKFQELWKRFDGFFMRVHRYFQEVPVVVEKVSGVLGWVPLTF